jgi:hypothetical protein
MSSTFCTWSIDRGVYCRSFAHNDTNYCPTHLLQVAEAENMYRDEVVPIIKKAREKQEGTA